MVWVSSQHGVSIMRVNGEREKKQKGKGENGFERENEDTRWNDTEFYDVTSEITSHCFCHILFMEEVTSSAGGEVVTTS